MKSARMLTICVLALGLIVCQVKVSEAAPAPMGTAFTYQGHLYDNNSVADGLYDFQFKLYNDPCAASQVGSDVNKPDVDVIDGYFTVQLDFNSPSAFYGYARWVQIGVRPGELSDPCAYTPLSPRQEVTPTPYALYAKTTGSVPVPLNLTGDTMMTDAIISATNTGEGDGVRGWSDMEAGVRGEGGVSGVMGYSATGAGVRGLSDSGNGVEGWSTSGYAGYFYGDTKITQDLIVDGNVGIGTASPAQDLEVEGGVFIDHSGMSHGADAGVALTVDGQLGKDILQVRDKGANRKLVVDSAGKVGIGTSSPTAKLHIAGVAGVDGVKFPDGTLQTTAAAGGGGDDLGNHIATQNIELNGNWLSGDGGNEGVFVNNAGNVGIGTTSPGQKLHVKDSVTGDFVAKIENTSTVNSLGLSVETSSSDNSAAFRVLSAGSISFYVKNTGRVGIGTTSPGAKLEVDGDLKVTGAYRGNIGPNNGAPFPRPAYDSGWVSLDQGDNQTLIHNLGGSVDNYVVDMQFKQNGQVNQEGYGGYEQANLLAGAYWFKLDSEVIGVSRRPDDASAEQIRIRIWVYK